MAFTCWVSRLRSSYSKTITDLRTSFFHHLRTRGAKTTAITSPYHFSKQNPFRFTCSNSLLPITLAGSLAIHFQSPPPLCDASLDSPSREIGGKGSTEFVVKGSHKHLPQELIEELKAICQDNMSMDYDERYFHGKPQHSFHKAVNIPDVVVFPRSEEEVSNIMKSCDKHKVPIVPYGGATSIEGHTLSPHGGVCIDMSLMQNVKALHVEDMDVVVEPGIGWMELNEYLEPHGLFFPLDPGPGATIGGMCATRCSGSLAVSV